MAGRGRGRGRGLSFDVEALGFSRGDTLPTPIAEPPPQFPAPLFRPVPLLTGKNYDYTVALKQELRGTFRDSYYFIPPVAMKKDIVRYSDKYQQIPAEDQVTWDWILFPKELRQKANEKHKKKNPLSGRTKKPTTTEIDLKKKLSELETKEKSEGDDEPKEENKKNPDEEEDEMENEEVYDDDELEEETDYALNYFDNGENYLDDEDDNLDDGPVY